MPSVAPSPQYTDVDEAYLSFSKHNQFTQKEQRRGKLHLNNIRQDVQQKLKGFLIGKYLPYTINVNNTSLFCFHKPLRMHNTHTSAYHSCTYWHMMQQVRKGRCRNSRHTAVNCKRPWADALHVSLFQMN